MSYLAPHNMRQPMIIMGNPLSNLHCRWLLTPLYKPLTLADPPVSPIWISVQHSILWHCSAIIEALLTPCAWTENSLVYLFDHQQHVKFPLEVYRRCTGQVLHVLWIPSVKVCFGPKGRVAYQWSTIRMEFGWRGDTTAKCSRTSVLSDLTLYEWDTITA